MIRPSNLLRNVSLATIDRLAKRAFMSSREISHELQRPSSFLTYRPTRIPSRTGSMFSTAAPSETERPDAAKDSESNATQLSEKQIQALVTAVEAYKEKLNATEDKYKRQLAETENVRQRFMRQVDDAKTFGIQNFCKDLLEIADVLELATESVPKDSISKADNASLKQLYDGLVMTQTQLTKIFNKHGLVAVRPLGEKFNPNVHEAVFQVKDDSKESGSVANVVKVGYLLHDRLLRPAKVGVYISS